MQAREAEEAAEEVIPEEVDAKNMTDEADTSTALHTHNQPGTSSEKWRILEQS